MAIFGGEPLLAALQDGERKVLLELGAPCEYRVGARLMNQGGSDRHIVAIQTGLAVVRADSANGRSVIFGLCGPMDVVGEMAGFDGGLRSATVTAMVDLRGYSLPEEKFHRYLKEHPRAYEAVVRSMTSRLRAADERQALATFPVLQRLARLLVDLHDIRPITGAGVQLTQSELAEAVGATRESVAKALAELRARKVLTVLNRRVTVLDIAALRAVALL